jgi:uncharacterized damage-inducible protein DinB
MSSPKLLITPAALALAIFATACGSGAPAADSGVASSQAALMTDLAADVTQLETKLVGLAREIPADKYNWRPGPGVRSVAELMLHVAADNYLFPGMLGTPLDPAIGIKADDYTTAQAFEMKFTNRDEIIAELEKSFTFLKQSMQATTGDWQSKQVSMFGQSFTGQQAWLLATVHLHEHLGQGIAYARVNGIVPPWSK